MRDVMTGVEVEDHPEDLLDLASTGGIREGQRQELQRHLATCLPCATQLRMSARSLAGAPTRPSDVHLERVAVNLVLQRTRATTGHGRATFARRWIPVGVGTLLLSSAALAATWLSVGHLQVKDTVPTVSGGDPPAPTTGKRPRRLGVRPREDGELAVDADPSIASPASPSEERDTAPAAEPVRVDRIGDRASAADLFARARSLRLSGNPTGALTVYRRLQKSYPGSPESRLSHLVAGRLWLERDRPELAASQFSRYLETGGSASEEALVGRAMALGRMGRVQEEAADLRRLLLEHPRSVYANRARARLNEGRP